MVTKQETKLVQAIESPVKMCAADAIRARYQHQIDRDTTITNSITTQFRRALIKAAKEKEFLDPMEAMDWLCPLLHCLPRKSALWYQVARVGDALEYADGCSDSRPENKPLGRKFRAHFAKVAAEIAAKKSKRTA